MIDTPAVKEAGRSRGRPRKNRIKLCLSLDADVIEAARSSAEKNGQTVSGAIEQAVRNWLAEIH